MHITYVCTNYNNSHYTIAAVKSIARNVGHCLRVYVVDNASRASDLEQLQELERSNSIVRIIANKENVGYFAGLNLGIKAALKDDPQLTWMVVGNNDLVFPADFCDKVESQQSNYSLYSVISPDVVTLDGKHQNPHVISNISRMREIFYDLYFSNYWLGMLIQKLSRKFHRATRRGDEDQWQIARPIYQGHGSCYLLTPKFFAQFDELWAPTFMMSEEVFLSMQLNKVGECVFYSPEISVTHHWHGSLQDLPSRSRWNLARDAHKEYRKYIKIFKMRRVSSSDGLAK
jgi:GT2 family glycosyltransferase